MIRTLSRLLVNTSVSGSYLTISGSNRVIFQSVKSCRSLSTYKVNYCKQSNEDSWDLKPIGDDDNKSSSVVTKKYFGSEDEREKNRL